MLNNYLIEEISPPVTDLLMMILLKYQTHLTFLSSSLSKIIAGGIIK